MSGPPVTLGLRGHPTARPRPTVQLHGGPRGQHGPADRRPLDGRHVRRRRTAIQRSRQHPLRALRRRTGRAHRTARERGRHRVSRGKVRRESAFGRRRTRGRARDAADRRTVCRVGAAASRDRGPTSARARGRHDGPSASRHRADRMPRNAGSRSHRARSSGGGRHVHRRGPTQARPRLSAPRGIRAAGVDDQAAALARESDPQRLPERGCQRPRCRDRSAVQRLSVKAPRVTRPSIPAGYGVSEDMRGALRWISVRRILEGALRYWIATSSRDDGPHLIQQWAAWVDDTLYFGGSKKTKWPRHLRLDPRVAVSVERTGYSIMVEGRAQVLATVTPELAAALVATFDKKYGYKTTVEDWTKGGLWALRAEKVFAWKFASLGTTATKFLFDQSGDAASSPRSRAPSAIRVS